MEWRVIPTFKKYEVSENGNIRNIESGKELKQSMRRDGYRKLILRDDEGVPKTVVTHRMVAYAFFGKSDLQVDHIDQDRLNNCVSNLRYASNSLNAYNKRWRRPEVIGVAFNKRVNKFIARVNKEKKRYNLGYFDTAEEAGRAYDEKAKELYGSDARLNYLPGKESNQS